MPDPGPADPARICVLLVDEQAIVAEAVRLRSLNCRVPHPGEGPGQ